MTIADGMDAVLPGRAAIAALLPHAGSMCLLDRVLAWDAAHIECAAPPPLDAAHPLRRDGVLPAFCGLEYPLQAAALHGALTAGGTPCAPGFVAVLRDVELHVRRLDDAGFGALRARARLEQRGPDGARYALALHAWDGRALLDGVATIAFGRDPTNAAPLGGASVVAQVEASPR